MRAFYCVGTHWDREWYETHQEFRMWLVELIDDLMDRLDAHPEFRCFHLDGQAIVIRDYLEARPEQRKRFLKFLSEERIVVGPWFVLPDEWLVSGESLIRNLKIGIRTCRRFGCKPMQFGYTPDQFGHIAAMPMIMNGFGIDTGIVWRGTRDEDYPAQFLWVGPDGSRMCTHKLMDKGSYGPFDSAVRQPVRDAGYTEKAYRKHFDPYINVESERSQTPLVLMLDAMDHQTSDDSMIRVFKDLSNQNPDIDFAWTTLSEYGDALRAYADVLPERTGELRLPVRDAHRGGQYLIAHTLSSRYPLKRQNDRCQSLLERWAEPLMLFQEFKGKRPNRRYLNLAWDWLLQNQPHDSICGCSIDQVHKDMEYRFDQCAQIADGIIRRAASATGDAHSDVDLPIHLAVHNPLPHRRIGVFDIDIPFPEDWPAHFIDGLFNAERVFKFDIRDSQGLAVPFQLRSIDHRKVHKRLDRTGRRTTHQGPVYRVAVKLDLPPAGVAGIAVTPSSTATRTSGSLRTGPLSASNGAVSIKINADGTVRVAHGVSGRVYDGLMMYEDCGDSGDGWTYGKVIDDRVIRSAGTRVTTSVEEDGPLRTVFRIDREFDLPSRLGAGTKRRSECTTILRVTDWVGVQLGSPCVHVRTRVENHVQDHRLRVMFPTGIDSPVSFADSPFAVVSRDILIPEEASEWHERLNPEKPFTHYFGVGDGQEGLAILSPYGLHEYEVTQTPERSLVLTLFRSYGQTVYTSGEPGGQLQGCLEFDYLVYPFAGPRDPVHLARLAAESQTGVLSHVSGQLLREYSYAQIEPYGTVLSALKPAFRGEGGIIRLWNPTPHAVTEKVRFAVDIDYASLCNLNEESIDQLPIDDGAFFLPVPPFGLATARFTWRGESARGSALTNHESDYDAHDGDG
ncbi:MAG: hypothetical protein AMXMBFR84_49110 [Candidatus Hydrogenedentota bacterium]